MIAYFQFLLLKGFSALVNALPEGMALRVGRVLGRGAYYFLGERRKIALENLHLAFGGEKSEKERIAIAKRAFQNLGLVAVEFLRIPGMTSEDFNKKVTAEGMEIFERVLNNKKGILMLLSHFGNWELMGFLSRIMGFEAIVIAKPIKNNPRVERMVTGIREAAGLQVLSTENAGFKILRALARNKMVGILMDQRAKRSEGVWAEFFGKKAPTTPALAVLSMRTGTPVVPVFMIRNEDGSHRLIVKEPVSLVHTGDMKNDVEVNTTLMNRTLETMIRQYPDQWFWVHRRWDRKRKGRHHRKHESSSGERKTS